MPTFQEVQAGLWSCSVSSKGVQHGIRKLRDQILGLYLLEAETEAQRRKGFSQRQSRAGMTLYLLPCILFKAEGLEKGDAKGPLLPPDLRKVTTEAHPHPFPMFFPSLNHICKTGVIVILPPRAGAM